MKYKFKLSAVLLALLFLVASNGVAIFEHICNTANDRQYSIFGKISCKMETPAASCCAKASTTKKNCCNHKQHFGKLNVEGFTANKVVLKHILHTYIFTYTTLPTYTVNIAITSSFYSGLTPPNNTAIIQSHLQPSSIKLQLFRC